MKSLIIYFSHTGENWMEDGIRNIDKGNTEIVAEKIKELTDADLFKVVPVKEYPYNYKECCDVAKQELNDDKRPQLVNMLSNIDEYDNIYIGSPIWWGHLPMPLFTQLEKLNFNGKTVKFYITHEGSKLGSCPKDIENLCHGANIKPGLAIQGCTVENCDSKLKAWL